VTLAATARYDASRLLCTLGAEASVHLAADGTATRVPALWSEVALQDLGGGFVGDGCEVEIPRQDLRRVARKDRLTRYPETFDALLGPDGWAVLLEEGGELGLETSAAETWTVDSVRRDEGLWLLTCTLNPRPLPRA